MSNSESTMRVFAGIPLDSRNAAKAVELVGQLRAASGPLHGARLSCPGSERLHLTLKFCGDVSEQRIPDMLSALQNLAWDPFELQFGGAGVFPQPSRPRVFWAGVRRGAEELTRLAQQVNTALVPLGLQSDQRPYHPHLTLCRVRDTRQARWDQAIEMAEAWQWPRMAVSRLVLWQSILQSHGPEYRSLGESLAAGK